MLLDESQKHFAIEHTHQSKEGKYLEWARAFCGPSHIALHGIARSFFTLHVSVFQIFM